MENSYYSEQTINNLKRKKSKILCISWIILGFSLVLFTILCFFVNDENGVLIKIIDSITLSICISCFIFLILNFVNPLKREIRHLDVVLKSPIDEFDCKVVDTGKVETIEKDIYAKSVLIKENERQLSLFCNVKVSDFQINKGKHLRLLVANNYIIEIKELDNED